MAVRTITSTAISKLHHRIASHQLTSVLAILVEELVDLVTNLAIGELDIVLGGTVIRHEGEETVVGNVKL